MTDYADDFVKQVTEDHLGADADATRDITSVGGGYTMQKDLGDGVEVRKFVSWRNLLEVCQEVCETSAQGGTKVYFDIVPIVSSSVTGKLAFQLRTYTGQRGNDRTQDSEAPIFVGIEWGNFQNGSWEEDYLEEVNVWYALGQGSAYHRNYSSATDTARVGMSIWNKREGARAGFNAEPNATTTLTDDAKTFLDESRPKFGLYGEVIETPAFRYGRDWYFGDLITVTYAGITRDAMISKVLVSRDSNGQENITANLEIEE